MKHSFTIVLICLFSYIGFSQDQQFEKTRFIAIGASITNAVFFYPENIEAKINLVYPNETVEVYNEGLGGSTISWWKNNIDEVLANYNPDTTIQTFCPIHIGGNDVTNTRPFSSLTQTQIDQMNQDLDYVIDAIETKGFTPILFDLTFRDYENTTFDNEENGSKPYNDNIIIPKIIERTPEFAFSDGQSFMQSYVLIFENHDSYLSPDNIHLSNGLEPYRDRFVNSICKYIFEGTIPEKLLREGETFTTGNTILENVYFDAHFLPQTEAANLQEALNAYGAVRLGEGDYTAAGDIVMTSNQQLYGLLDQSGTSIGGNITIKNGSRNVHIENYDGENRYDIIFESGDPITECTLSSIYYSELVLNNASIEDNLFKDISRVTTSFDCSESGYFRNNVFIKIFQQSYDDQVTMIGNDVTPSYGNIELSRNILTNRYNSTYYENLDNHKLIGSDAELWANSGGASSESAFYFRDIGNLKMYNSNGYSASGASEYDIEADQLIIQRKNLGSEASPIIRANTDYLGIWIGGDEPIKETGVWDFTAHSSNSDVTELNDTDLSSMLTGSDASTLEDLILDLEYTPIPKPIFEELPNPTGDNWAIERIGQLDETATIQALINANGVAELEDRIYYIGSSLFLQKDQGIVGKGTGKTAIVGLTDDFPLIYCQDDVSSGADPNNIFAGQLTNISYKVAHMTLQGGSDGIYIQPIGNETTVIQITNTAWRHLIFRNQENGVHLDSFYGFDNNFLSNLSFVNCNIGFYQESQPRPQGMTGEWSTMMYVDKTMFYHCRFINCGIGLDMRPIRGNNLNSWVDCLFDGNEIAMYTGSSNALYCANSIFTNTHGDFVQSGGAPMSYYSCDFNNNTCNTLFYNHTIYAEGCNFNDYMPFDVVRTNGRYYLSNNKISNAFSLSNMSQGFLINNTFFNNSDLNKLMIEVINGNPLVILDQPSDPYPQLLVKQYSDLCTVDCPQTPYTSAFTIPGKIEMENYDLGGEGISYSDEDITNLGGEYRQNGVDIQVTTDIGGGYTVGFIRKDEWLEYTVNVTESGNYDIVSRVASDLGGGIFQLEIDGDIIVSDVDVGATGGWQTFVDLEYVQVTLEEGEHVLRFYVIEGGFNFNWMEFTKSAVANINESESLNAISIFPNPAKDQINISGAEGASYEFFDQTGRQFNSGIIESVSHSINTSHLSAGFYTIKLIRERQIKLEKILIN